MNFDDLDAKMRVYEQSLDQVLLPEFVDVTPGPHAAVICGVLS